MYNKSAIMKRAWELKRKLNVTIGEALKMSWRMAKQEAALKEYHCEPEGRVTFNIWQNYGLVRAYYKCSWMSKYQNNKGNYISL